ncbi:ABC transporter substrate-binding protein [Amycolatopsis thermoflava]|uniref:ABC transporter substrate-binding protein n=1 Tax=Amycolatopsis thermoflava TaxID=84480 RepID=UPI003664E900
MRKIAHRRTGALALAVAAASALAACSASSTGSTGDAGTPRPGGTLRFGLDYTPSCLDPQQAGEGPNLEVLESLTYQDPRSGDIVPSLASSWEVSPDAKSFTFHLREGVTFSDGSALDASVVKDNLDGITKLGATASNSGANLAGVTAVTAPDPRTVTVTFASPNAQFLQATSTPALAVLSRGSLAVPAAERCAGKIVGTGPFVLTSYTAKQEIVLSKRQGYAWGPPSWQHTGDAYLDRIEIKVLPEAATRTGSLSSGQLDVSSNIAPQDEPQFDGNGFTLLSHNNPGVVLSLYPNERRPVLQDKTVRQALQKAVNRPEVISTFLSPRYRAATSVLSSTTPGYTDLGTALAYDPDGAKALLDAAGWRPGPDGVRVRDGVRLSLDVIFGRPQSLELIQQQLKTVGIELTLRQLQISELQSQFAAGNFDFFLLNSTRADPDVLRTLFGRAQLTDADVLKAALATQAGSLDPQVRQRAAADAQRSLVEDAHVIPVNEQALVVGVSDKVHGIGFTATSGVSFYDAWLS